MEKYAVDKENDQVEREAQKLVKIGACKNLSDARKISLEKDERKKKRDDK